MGDHRSREVKLRSKKERRFEPDEKSESCRREWKGALGHKGNCSARELRRRNLTGAGVRVVINLHEGVKVESYSVSEACTLKD